MDKWYYKLFGAEFGPVNFDELVELAKSHTLSVDDEVRFGDEGLWRRAGSIGQLMTHLPYQAAKSRTDYPKVSQDRDSATSDSNPQWSTDNDFAATANVEPPKVEDRWWCKILDNEVGPMTFDELEELAKNRTMSRDDQVRFGEHGQWRRAGSMGQLMTHFPFQGAERVVTTGQKRSGEQIPVVDVDVPQPTSVPIAPAASETVPVVSPLAPLAPHSDDRWWCLIDNREYGPVGFEKIKEWAASGRLHAYDYLRAGLGEYVAASEVAGLFPKRPEPAARPNVSSPSVQSPKTVSSHSAPKPVTDAAMSTMSDTAPAMTPAAEQRPYTPSPTSTSSAAPMSSFGGSGPARSPIPVRRPTPSRGSSGGGLVAILTGPIGMGVGGVIVLGVLIYFALPFLGGGNSADIKRVQTLQGGFNSIIAARSDGGSPAEIKAATGKLDKLAAKVLIELKGVTKGPSKKVVDLAKLIQKLTKEDLTKSNALEMEVTSKFGVARRALGMK